jgi:hypothetical protein
VLVNGSPYVTNRQKIVMIKSSNTHGSILSECSKVQHGVPQDSILGLLLFLLYIDLEETFADRGSS